MRLLFAVPLVLLIALPATAQQRDSRRPAPSADQVATALNDPLIQEGVAAIVGQMADAILDTHVGPMAHYADPRDGIRPNDTLRDLAHRDDPALERHLHDSTVGAVASAGRGAKDAVAMTAEINAAAARLRRVLDNASRAVDSAQRGY